MLVPSLNVSPHFECVSPKLLMLAQIFNFGPPLCWGVNFTPLHLASLKFSLKIRFKLTFQTEKWLWKQITLNSILMSWNKFIQKKSLHDFIESFSNRCKDYWEETRDMLVVGLMTTVLSDTGDTGGSMLHGGMLPLCQVLWPNRSTTQDVNYHSNTVLQPEAKAHR